MFMADEKIFTIPFRDVFAVERTKRAKKAVSTVRAFLERHMKSEEINIGKSINDALWARGIQKPPRRIRIHALKIENVIFSEMLGVDIKPPSVDDIKKKQEKKQEKAKKVKEIRKERKKMSIQEEIEEESGKKAEAPAENKEEKKEQ